MPVTRQKKEQALGVITEAFATYESAIFTDFRGVDVAGITTLRNQLRAQGAKYVVAKRTLAEKALAAKTSPELDRILEGASGIAFTGSDAVAVAKVLVDFKKEYEKFVIKGALLGGEFLSGDRVTALSKTPPREVLLAMLFGVMKAPHRGFVNVGAGVIRKFLGTLEAIAEKKRSEG